MKANEAMSMVNPSTDALMTKVESRYGLVVLAAKRARQLLDGEEIKSKRQSTKDVTNALEEIVEDKISYRISKESMK
ncbi:MAG: DNA-directed RNA polymerase subunit omega [Selenomonadaceae bacterium]|nr:DNA-directed RNA polymerase subunit omega [Selenomonadaceae bacterium]MBR0284382.1 DNA-directed RNA polymerase subunit omega [Selenomonadaceae bacterium]MBR6343583.1 DNA-directed RNA polymerase subunit omega [Selenomonadaceae bacterium]MBR6711334.1 DNA-directed RNA polymerase subunit omega [Selenomonadaceae bacterium]MBR6906131.1 DNA-directed RNA polymerase subunit omega [Selenomonadaceae bacterium]